MPLQQAWTRIVPISDCEPNSIQEFSCGESDMDHWLREDALQWHRQSKSVVHVAIDEHKTIVGFFTLTNHMLQHRVFNGQSSVDIAGNIPCILLGRLGVDRHYSTQNAHSKFHGQGRLLVAEAKRLAYQSAQIAACRLLYVQAKNDTLIAWYKQQGFVSLPKNPRNMVFDLQQLQSAI